MNSMLINKYRDGGDSIRAHRDSPTSFGEEPTIIVISLGSPRDLVFKKVKTDENPQSTEIDTDYPQEFEFKMTDNSLFIMGGGSQRYYTHEIPKSDEAGFRYSITMREYIPHYSFLRRKTFKIERREACIILRIKIPTNTINKTECQLLHVQHFLAVFVK